MERETVNDDLSRAYPALYILWTAEPTQTHVSKRRAQSRHGNKKKNFNGSLFPLTD